MSVACRLAGKVAFVTGGASGIGRSVCELFAAQGARVVAADLNKEALHNAFTGHEAIHPVSCDVSSRESLAAALQEGAEALGAVPSIAVNCAGITRDGFLLKMSEKSFDEVIAVNLKGSFLLAQLFGQALAKAEQPGSLVLLSSISAKNGNIGQANYAAAKAGVIGLTKTSANELAKFNIRVNAVLPGFIDTPMTEAMPEHIKQMVIPFIPLRRMGQPGEIAHVCLFLASEDSSYVTGAAIEATGGFYV